MSKGLRIKSVVNVLIKFFQSQGIKVMRYDAYSTNSVYLKLDYGVLYSVRISDHPGKKHLSYRFNVIRHYRGARNVKSQWDWNREYYSLTPSEINEMCRSIMQLRKQLVAEKGLYGYQSAMERRRKSNQNAKGFWNSAKDLG